MFGWFRHTPPALPAVDTTALDAADEAIAVACNAHRQVRVRARALRMDVSCGDPVGVIDRMGKRVVHQAGLALRHLYSVDHETPAEMQELLGKL